MITEWVYLEGQGQAAVAGELGDTVTEIGLHQAQLEATIANYEYFHVHNYSYHRNNNSIPP